MKKISSKNTLDKFAFWNKKEAKKVFDLNEKSDKIKSEKIHLQKCGLCGS